MDLCYICVNACKHVPTIDDDLLCLAAVVKEIADETDRETGRSKQISAVPIYLSIYSPNGEWPLVISAFEIQLFCCISNILFHIQSRLCASGFTSNDFQPSNIKDLTQMTAYNAVSRSIVITGHRRRGKTRRRIEFVYKNQITFYCNNWTYIFQPSNINDLSQMTAYNAVSYALLKK